MPLSEAQLNEVRRWVGDSPPDADLDEAFDRLGTVRDTIVETLARRRANLEAAPATFAIPGEYSQSTGENIKALGARLAELDDSTLATDVVFEPQVKRLVRYGDDGLPGR